MANLAIGGKPRWIGLMGRLPFVGIAHENLSLKWLGINRGVCFCMDSSPYAETYQVIGAYLNPFYDSDAAFFFSVLNTR